MRELGALALIVTLFGSVILAWKGWRTRALRVLPVLLVIGQGVGRSLHWGLPVGRAVWFTLALLA